MSRYDRAAQFAPYSALSGYEDAVEETAKTNRSQFEHIPTEEPELP